MKQNRAGSSQRVSAATLTFNITMLRWRSLTNHALSIATQGVSAYLVDAASVAMQGYSACDAPEGIQPFLPTGNSNRKKIFLPTTLHMPLYRALPSFVPLDSNISLFPYLSYMSLWTMYLMGGTHKYIYIYISSIQNLALSGSLTTLSWFESIYLEHKN